MALAVAFDPADDVAVVTEDVVTAEPLEGLACALRAAESIPAGHKVAMRPIGAGCEVRRFGHVIGVASQDIPAGSWVHVQNLEYRAQNGHARAGSGVRPVLAVPPEERRTVSAIRRPQGGIATRNYVGVIATVNCSATAARLVARPFEEPESLAPYPNVDGVVALTHGSGCCLTPEGPGLELLRRTIRGYAAHPNFAAIAIVGLGCETNQVDDVVASLDLGDTALLTMTIQDAGGTQATVREAVQSIRDLLPAVDRVERVELPVNGLVVAMECGGSDAYSGLTANPALGVAADLLVAQGCTVVFSETPEIYGAEHLLVERAIDQQVADKLLDRIRWWKEYTELNGASMNNNPTPGNLAGGISTILEKSLGAISKGGTSPLTDVVGYAEPIPRGGLVFMDTPGYDPVSVTGMVAGGANVVCFTTGRGSAFGCKPAPSIKIASNSVVFERMRDDMDVNAGRILSGAATVEQVGREIFETVLAVASGERTKSELLGLGDNEFVPWQLGAVM
jgi:altronate hydrolase